MYEKEFWVSHLLEAPTPHEITQLIAREPEQEGDGYDHVQTFLGQASLNFTQEGVMFHKHEEKACLMQISRVHPEDELDFSHILDSQVKNDLIGIGVHRTNLRRLNPHM
ncbi:hypothetical protein TNCV_3306751 [Trichonephila clavipes]|nr:hypothetical protein TNCV_3306751 [Trichonephila clavipes]